jgi:hypothetical protein
MIDNRTQVFDVAMKNARTIEACLDRLAMMGADRELKMMAGRLSRLSFRAAPFLEKAMSAPRANSIAFGSGSMTADSTDRQTKPRACRGFSASLRNV